VTPHTSRSRAAWCRRPGDATAQRQADRPRGDALVVARDGTHAGRYARGTVRTRDGTHVGLWMRRVRGQTRDDRRGERQVDAAVFALRRLKNCARITRSTRERSSSPPPQAPLRPEEIFSVSGRGRGRGTGAEWDVVGRGGAVRLGTAHRAPASALRRCRELQGEPITSEWVQSEGPGPRRPANFRGERASCSCAIHGTPGGHDDALSLGGHDDALSAAPHRPAPSHDIPFRTGPSPSPSPRNRKKSLPVVAGPVEAVKNCAPSSTS
jgi:hypothetical protein